MDDLEKPRSFLGVRHLQILHLLFGTLLITCIKVDMSLAIIAMTESTQNNTFDWSHQTQSLMLSSYKWGYMLAKIPGGVLSSRFGGKIVLIACGISNCVLSNMLPIAGYYGGWQAVCACRALQGLSSGVLIPTTHTLTGKWVPQEERARLASGVAFGETLGTGIEYILAGLIAAKLGWEAIFYMNGTVLGIWTVIYMILGSSSPQDSRMISETERLYIQTSLGQVKQRNERIKTPWKQILTSTPFLILILTHIGSGWGHWTILTEMPTYFNKVLGVNIKSNGMLSSLPYIGGAVFVLIFGCLSDYISGKNVISTTNSRKIFNSIATCGPAMLLVGVSFVTNDITVAALLFTICVSLKSASFSGFNTLPSEWRKVFVLAACVYIVSNSIFVLFGTSKKQKWNDLEEENKTDSTKNASIRLIQMAYEKLEPVCSKALIKGLPEIPNQMLQYIRPRVSWKFGMGA